MLLLTRLKSERIYAEIDWSLLLMFVGLFIIVAGAQRALLGPDLIADVGRLHLDQVPVLSALTAVLSNLVSNVPAVLMLKPFVEALKDHDRAWLIIAMASTLAGNFTVIGSIANLIVVQKAASLGVSISFWDYFRVGAPLTIVTGAQRHDRAWLTIAMASTLAGNFTVIGSIANLIVVQKAASLGVSISFWDYFRVGAPLTILTLAIGTLWLWL